MSPRRSPMATRITSLSIRNPKEDTGKACSHAPDSFAQASGAVSRRSLGEYPKTSGGKRLVQVEVVHHVRYSKSSRKSSMMNLTVSRAGCVM